MNDTPRHPQTDPDPDAEARERLNASIAAYLADADERYLICREGGHNLGLRQVKERYRVRLYNHPKARGHIDFIREVRVCDCCTAVRTDLFVEQTRELVSRAYDRPDGYDHTGGRVTRGRVRREWDRRYPLD